MTEADEKWLIHHYKHTKNAAILERFGICATTLHRIVRRLKLKKSHQFMHKAMVAATAAARQAVLNETGEAKRRRAENAIKNCMNTRFKTGVYAHANRSKEERDAITQKAVASWKKNRAADELRLNWGLETRYHYRFPKLTDPKKQKALCGLRYSLRKLGYKFDKLGAMVCYISPDTKRSEKREKHGKELGLIFREYGYIHS